MAHKSLRLAFASSGFLAAGASVFLKTTDEVVTVDDVPSRLKPTEPKSDERSTPNRDFPSTRASLSLPDKEDGFVDTAVTPPSPQPPPPSPPGRQPTWRANTGNRLSVAVDNSIRILETKRTESGSPGISLAVTVDGKSVMNAGVGFSDVENYQRMTPKTVARIASISKPLTMVAVAKLVEDGKIDLDKKVSEYLTPEVWPEDKGSITLRQLLSHSSGVRHYEKKGEIEAKTKGGDEAKKREKNEEFESKEYHITKKYKKASDALEIFKNDELIHEPGTKFHYSTHAFTLVAAVVESVTSKPFDFTMKETFKELGLPNTRLDENDSIIANRCRYYQRKAESHILINAPHVDNSWKYAGGGFISTVGDLAKFGNAMLYSYQHDGESKGKLGFLKPETIRKMWSPLVPYRGGPIGSDLEKRDSTFWHYGLGWDVLPTSAEHAFARDQQMHTRHTGGAVGASSVLLIRPGSEESASTACSSGTLPRGIVVALIANMEGVGLSETAMKIADEFRFLHNQNQPKPLRIKPEDC